MLTTSLRKTLAIASLSTLAALPLHSFASSFTPDQQQEIGQIASTYITKHPEVLQQASQNLQQQQQEQQMQNLQQQTLAHVDELIHDKATPTVGPANAKVSVVEFFDYQCMYCSHTAPQIEAVMKAHPEVRYVFKEFPIFGNQWEASTQAAETGLTVFKDKGAKAYIRYHNGIYATGKDEGKLQDSDIQRVAERVGVTRHDVDANRSTADAWINDTMTLAQNLGIMGTPTLMVMPTHGANASNTTVIPGATSSQTLSAAIAKAAK